MTPERWLIVNADDFGQSPGINRGIIIAHEKGIVTSASLMVRWPAAGEAALYARSHPQLSLGLHVDLGEWAHREGTWQALYSRVDLEDEHAIEQELLVQLALFQQLTGRTPTHLDSHQHVHLRPAAHQVFIRQARHLAVPLRHEDGPIRYCGRFYGHTTEGEALPEAITVDALLNIIASLPEGATELGCHPGIIDEEDHLETMYRAERFQELQALCHSGVRAAVSRHGARLIAFSEASGAITSSNRNGGVLTTPPSGVP